MGCGGGAFLLGGREQGAKTLALLAREKDDDDHDGSGTAGMEDAFRQLDALQSLDDDDDVGSDPKAAAVGGSGRKKITKPDGDELVAPDGDGAAALSPEKEVKVYQDMVKDLEEKEEDELYSDVMSDLAGGKSASASIPRKAPPSSGRSAGGGAGKGFDRKVTTVAVEEGETQQPPPSEEDAEEFMNQALKEALEDVKVQNPSISDSILDDREIMKEIEAIFERGNDKLMESLEEIRKEQVRACVLRGGGEQ